MIQLKSVSKTIGRTGFRKKVLVGITATFEAGRNYVILGARGSGKSTLLKVMSGMTQPTEGRVERRGRVSPPLGTAAAVDGMKTGRQLARLLAQLYDGDVAEVSRFVTEFAQMGDELDLPISSLPGPRRARLSFALGYAIPCDFYLVDEQIGYGDAGFKAACREAFEVRRRQSGTVVVTKDLRVAAELGEFGGVLHTGSLQLYDTVDEALDAYRVLEPDSGVGSSARKPARGVAPLTPEAVAAAAVRRAVAAAQEAERAGRNREAVDLANAILAAAPNQRDALLVLATAAQKLGLDDVAADAYVKVADGKDTNALRLAVRTYTRARRWESLLAAVDGTQGVEESVHLLIARVKALSELERWPDMAAALAQLAKLNLEMALEPVLAVVKTENARVAPSLIAALRAEDLPSVRSTRVGEVLTTSLLRLAAGRLAEGDEEQVEAYVGAAAAIDPDNEVLRKLNERRRGAQAGVGSGDSGAEPEAPTAAPRDYP